MAQGDSKFAFQDHGGLDAVPAVDYHAEWKAFALRRNLALVLLAGWVPVCAGLFALSGHQPVACLVGMGLWLGCALTAIWWAGEFRCPRCRRRYAALGYGRGPNLTRGIFDKACCNCKLTKFEIVQRSFVSANDNPP
jgi:hypothetical protein